VSSALELKPQFFSNGRKYRETHFTLIIITPVNNTKYLNPNKTKQEKAVSVTGLDRFSLVSAAPRSHSGLTDISDLLLLGDYGSTDFKRL